MNSRRPSLVKILVSVSIKQPALFAECQRQSRDAAIRGLYSRIFDNYPPLLCMTDNAHYQKLFAEILTRLEVRADYEITDSAITKDIDLAIEAIANIGIAELLLDDGNLNPEVLKVMGLKSSAHLNEKKSEIINSFLSTSMQHIHAALAQGPHTEQLHSLCNYINKRKASIIEELLATGWQADLNKIGRYVEDHPIETAGLLVSGLFGAAAIAGGITAAVHLAKLTR